MRFYVVGLGFNGAWDDIDNVQVALPLFLEIFSFGWEPSSQWKADLPQTVPFQARRITLFKEQDMGVWQLRCQYRNDGPFVPLALLEFRLKFPNGFPKWPGSYELLVFFEQDWTFGVPLHVQLLIGEYHMLEPNFCTL